jgi:hypothetical protein
MEYPASLAISSAHSSHSNIPVALGRFEADELTPPVGEPWLTTPPSQKHTYVDLSDAEAVDDVELHVPVVSTTPRAQRVSPPSTSVSPLTRRRSQLSKVERAADGDGNGLQALDLDAVGPAMDSLTSSAAQSPVLNTANRAANEALGHSALLSPDNADTTVGNGGLESESSRTNLV